MTSLNLEAPTVSSTEKVFTFCICHAYQHKAHVSADSTGSKHQHTVIDNVHYLMHLCFVNIFVLSIDTDTTAHCNVCH
jgi:hypothetical protein